MTKTYIYFAVQHPNNILSFRLPIKIGYTDHLKDRIKKFKGEQWCINPQYLRIIECEKKHTHPDKVFHTLFNQLLYNHVDMVDKHKELFWVDNFDIIDETICLFEKLNHDIKYHTNPSEIDNLVNGIDDETLCSNVMNDIINTIISKSDNEIICENNYNEDKDIDFMIVLISKAISNNTPKGNNNGKNYLSPVHSKRIISHITDFKIFRSLIESDNKLEIKLYLEEFLEKLKKCKSNGIFSSNHPSTIIKCIYKMY